MAIGQPINKVPKGRAVAPSGGGLTQGQKTGLVLVAALCGPALFKRWMDKPAADKVDLSGFNIVTNYDTPAIEKMDSTLVRPRAEHRMRKRASGSLRALPPTPR